MLLYFFCHVLPCAEWSLTFFPYLEILKLLRNDRTGELPHWGLPLAQSFWSVRLCIPTVAMDLLNPRKTRLPNRPILLTVKKKNSIESSDLPPNTNWRCQIPPQTVKPSLFCTGSKHSGRYLSWIGTCPVNVPRIRFPYDPPPFNISWMLPSKRSIY